MLRDRFIVDSGAVRFQGMQVALILAALILCIGAGMSIGVQGTEGFVRVAGFALVIALCAGVMIRPKWGVCILLWVTYLNDVLHTLLPSGQMFSAGKFIGFVVLIGWFASQLAQGRVRVRWVGSGWLFLALLFQMFLSAWANGDFDADAFLLATSGVILYFLITNLLVERRDLDLFIAHMIGIAILLSILGLMRMQQVDFLVRVGARPEGMLRNANELPVYLNIILPFLLVAMTRRDRWRPVMLVSALFLVSSNVAFGSRVGVVVSIFILLVLSLRYRCILSFALCGIVVLVALSPLVPSVRYTWDRFVNPSPSDLMAVTGRLNALYAGVKEGLAHPLFGIGPLRWVDMVSTFPDYPYVWIPNSPHNTYIQAFAELGVPGLAVLLALLTLVGLRLWRLRHPVDKPWTWAMWTLVLGYSTSLTCVTHLYGRDLFIVVALAETYCGLVERKREGST